MHSVVYFTVAVIYFTIAQLARASNAIDSLCLKVSDCVGRVPEFISDSRGLLTFDVGTWHCLSLGEPSRVYSPENFYLANVNLLEYLPFVRPLIVDKKEPSVDPIRSRRRAIARGNIILVTIVYALSLARHALRNHVYSRHKIAQSHRVHFHDTYSTYAFLDTLLSRYSQLVNKINETNM